MKNNVAIAYNPYQAVEVRPHSLGHPWQKMSFQRLVEHLNEVCESQDAVVGVVCGLQLHTVSEYKQYRYRLAEHQECFDRWTVRGHLSKDPHSGFTDFPWYAPKLVVQEECQRLSEMEGTFVELFEGWTDLTTDAWRDAWLDGEYVTQN